MPVNRHARTGGLDPRSVQWAGSLNAANLDHGHYGHRATDPCDGKCERTYNRHKAALLAKYPPTEIGPTAFWMYDSRVPLSLRDATGTDWSDILERRNEWLTKRRTEVGAVPALMPTNSSNED